MKDGGDGGWVGGWWDWEGRGTREVRGGGGAGVKMGGELYMVCAVPFRRRSRRVDSCSCSSPASPTYTHTPPLPPAPRRAAPLPCPSPSGSVTSQPLKKGSDRTGFVPAIVEQMVVCGKATLTSIPGCFSRILPATHPPRTDASSDVPMLMSC